MADKVYVDVLAMILADGRKKPLGLVLDVRRAASLRAGGVGDRYTCEVAGKAFFLFDEDGKWFVERGK